MVVRQFAKFAGVGVLGTAVHYFTLVLLVHAVGVHAVLASTIGFLFGAVVNYYLNYFFTFVSTKAHYDAMPKFCAVAAVGMVINGAIMEHLISVFSTPYIVAQVFATALVLVWNFSANRIWTFSERTTKID